MLTVSLIIAWKEQQQNLRLVATLSISLTVKMEAAYIVLG